MFHPQNITLFHCQLYFNIIFPSPTLSVSVFRRVSFNEITPLLPQATCMPRVTHHCSLHFDKLTRKDTLLNPRDDCIIYRAAVGNRFVVFFVWNPFYSLVNDIVHIVLKHGVVTMT